MSLGGNSSKSDSKSNSTTYYDPTQTGLVDNYATGVAAAANDPNSPLAYHPYSGPGLTFGDPTQLTNLQGYSAPKAAATTYQASTIDPSSVPNVTAGQIASTDLSKYMNPYNQNVIDTTNADIARSQAIAGAGADSQATASGAFGGSRSAVLRNLSDDSYIRAQAATDAQLRQQGYTNAQQAAGQDIGTKLQADQGNQQAGLTIGQANQAAQNTAAGTNAAAQNTASLANQQADLQAAQTKLQALNINQQQAEAIFGANWAQYLNSQQDPQAVQALVNQAMGLIPTSPLGTSSSTGSSSSFGFSASMPKS